MVTDTKAAAVVSLRRRFREAVRAAKNGRESILVPELAREVLAELEAQHPGFATEMAEEMAQLIVYEETLREVGESRSSSLFDIDQVAQSAARRSIGERLLRWEEWTGERHYRLGAMTRQPLQAAAGVRRKRADHELRVAGWLERLAEALPDDRVTVEQHFKARDVETLYRQVVLDDDDTP